jgi:predicted ATPase
MGVGDEQVWPVPSLDLSGGIDSAAVNLFVERAQSVAPRFSMATPDEADAVVEICRRLDGIPLAIELGASRMASMTASEVRDRLDHRFRLLVGSRPGLERDQTLRHSPRHAVSRVLLRLFALKRQGPRGSRTPLRGR